MTLPKAIEALLFASPKPLQLREIQAALRGAGEAAGDEEAAAFGKVTAADVSATLQELQAGYVASERAFYLCEQINGWTLLTVPEAARWVRQLYPEAKPARLSGPALETLAIIAYRQPVTKADIEAVRGVAVDGVMQMLLERALVKIHGRAEVPGRPLLYGTTEYFLEHFGLRTVEELPNVSELRRVPLPVAPPPPEASAAQPESGGTPAPPPEAPAPPAEAASADSPDAAPSAEPGEAPSAPPEPGEPEPPSPE